MRTLIWAALGLMAGWFIGAALGLGVSRVFYAGGADQTPILTAPLGALVGAIGAVLASRR